MHRTILLAFTATFALTASAQVNNGSFESGGNFDLSGWIPSICVQPSGYSLSLPPNGGAQSLKLKAATTTVCSSVPDNNYVYQELPWVTSGMPLRASWWWSKDFNTQSSTVCLGIVHNGWQGCAVSWSGAATFWTEQVQDAMMTLQAGDTAAIALFGGEYSGNDGSGTYFDLVEVISTVGIEEHARPLKAHPNPANEVLWIELSEAPIAVDLIDALGRTVALGPVVRQQGEWAVDVSAAAPGANVLRIRTSTGIRTVRFLKA